MPESTVASFFYEGVRAKVRVNDLRLWDVKRSHGFDQIEDLSKPGFPESQCGALFSIVSVAYVGCVRHSGLDMAEHAGQVL